MKPEGGSRRVAGMTEGQLALVITAAVVVIGIAYSVLSAPAPASSPSPSTASASLDPSDYRNMCAGAGFGSAKAQYGFLRGAEPSIATPTIVSEGPPVEVACAATTRRGVVVSYRMQVLCKDPLDRNCVSITGASGG